MHEEICIAGFGGQGVLLAGKILAIAAMHEGKHVMHTPSYGAEMRGGTAHCRLIISDNEITSPAILTPTVVLALNAPSFEKFKERVKSGGILIYNTSIVQSTLNRSDINVYPVPAGEIAEEGGSKRSVNMAMIGVLLKACPQIASFASLLEAVDEAVSLRNRTLNEANRTILEMAFNSL